MITNIDAWVLRHASGRYMRPWLHFETLKRIDGSDSRMHDPNSPPKLVFWLVDNPWVAEVSFRRDSMGRFLQNEEWVDVADQFEIECAPCCRCCGYRHGTIWGSDGHWRCDKHRFRNPCAVEGCKRTRTRSKAVAFSEDDHLCGEHWKMFCPPGSKMRRIYNRLWRLRKRRGEWTPDLERRYWTAWRRIVSNARAGSAGDIDMNEINQMFGWDA